MKNVFLFCAIALIAFEISSCSLDNVNPQQPNVPITGKSDTSTTLITNTSLVGTWNIVTDTVAYNGNFMYHGTSGDHYIFTKYGNLYINNGFNAQVDTAVYTIYADNTVKWTTSYWKTNDVFSRQPLTVGPYKVSDLTSTTLTLTEDVKSNSSSYYEQIKFLKAQ
jgi:phage gp45-like